MATLTDCHSRTIQRLTDIRNRNQRIHTMQNVGTVRTMHIIRHVGTMNGTIIVNTEMRGLRAHRINNVPIAFLSTSFRRLRILRTPNMSNRQTKSLIDSPFAMQLYVRNRACLSDGHRSDRPISTHSRRYWLPEMLGINRCDFPDTQSRLFRSIVQRFAFSSGTDIAQLANVAFRHI